MRFAKMHGAGNDFICVDLRRDTLPQTPGALARRLCDRRFGIGADGLVLIEKDPEVDVRMVIYNADGSRPEMCGNALRCVIRYLKEQGDAAHGVVRVRTDRGVLEGALEGWRGAEALVRTEMGIPVFERDAIPMKGPPGRVIDEALAVKGRTWAITAVSLGNPHCVVFVEDVNALDLEHWGPAFENHASFPQRVNTEFATVRDVGNAVQRTWERGVGETLACGTGATAVCAAGVVSGRTARLMTCHLRGGDLVLEWRRDDVPVSLTGPAVRVFDGDWR